VAASPFDQGEADLFLGPALLIGLPITAALAAGGHTAVPLVLAVAVVTGSATGRWRDAGLALPAAAAGLVALGCGLGLSRGDLRPGNLAVEEPAAATALLVGAAALIAAATLAPPTVVRLRLLVLPATVVGWSVAPTPKGAVLAAAGLALVSVGLAKAGRRSLGAIAFASAAAAGFGPTRPAAALLAAAAVLLAAVDPPAGVIAALPGVAAGALALAAGPLTLASAAVAAALTAASAAAVLSARGRVVLTPGRLPAATLIAWLAVAPASWAWAGPTALGPYQDGSSRAVAAGLLVLVAVWTLGQARPPAPEWRPGGW
jgi:hypothetical protein